MNELKVKIGSTKTNKHKGGGFAFAGGIPANNMAAFNLINSTWRVIKRKRQKNKNN